MDAEITSLIAQITEAFREVERGDGVSLHETYVLDEYGNDAWRQEARGWDTDTHWWEVPDEDLLVHGPYLCYLDQLGWRYYLPVCMIHSLKIFHDPHRGETDSRDYALEMLTYYDQADQDQSDRLRVRLGMPPRLRRPDWGVPGDREKQKWSILTPVQGQAVCRYLQFVAAHEDNLFSGRDAEKGLRQYWGQFSLSE